MTERLEVRVSDTDFDAERDLEAVLLLDREMLLVAHADDDRLGPELTETEADAVFDNDGDADGDVHGVVEGNAVADMLRDLVAVVDDDSVTEGVEDDEALADCV